MSIEIHTEIPQPKFMYSIEGIDGSGKTSVTKLVVANLKTYGVEAELGKSPSPTAMGEFLRANLGTLEAWQRHSLFVMDMIDVLKRKQGVIVWDRYIDSNIVSNKDTSPQDAEKWITCLPTPTKTFLLDIDPEVVIRDRKDSLHDHSLDLDWQKLKRERYLDLAQTHPERIVVLDATQSISFLVTLITNHIKEDVC